MTWMQLYRHAVMRHGSTHYLMHCGLLAAQASADRALKSKLAAARALQPGMLFDTLDAHCVPVPAQAQVPGGALVSAPASR